MNLKEFSRNHFYPHPAIKDLRDYFYKHSREVFLGIEFSEKSFPEKVKFFIANFSKFYLAVQQQYPDQLSELVNHLSAISTLGTLSLTYSGFFPPIKLLASDEQFQKWNKLMMEGRIIGAYGQTEIGHGSDVQSLQATATYDKERKVFILNSPTTSSIKFWPGALGIQCTHAVVQAQTYINGKHYGLQTFVVPIRDPLTYKLYGGLECGDIGPKLGYLWGDNGYLKLNNYAVPLDNLMMKFIKVEEDGKVTTAEDKNAIKIGYGGMLGLRISLCTYFLNETWRAVIFEYRDLKKRNHLEPLQRRRLLNEFSHVYSGMMTIEWMYMLHRQFNANVKMNLKAALRGLEELHLVASGMKALYSAKCVEINRKVTEVLPLGGLMMAGSAPSYSEIVPSVTYEGDNVVMLQQTARGLCKYMQCVENEEFKKIPESFKFLEEYRGLLDKHDELKVWINNAEELVDSRKIEEILDVIGLFSVKECYEKMKEKLISGGAVNKVWNEDLQKYMVDMAYTVTKGLSYKMTKKMLENQDIQGSLLNKDMGILREILLVYGLNILEQNVNLACRFKIGASVEKLEGLIRGAQDIVFKRLESSVEYIADSALFYEEELYYVRDYKTWKKIKNGEDIMKDSIKDHIHKFSKL